MPTRVVVRWPSPPDIRPDSAACADDDQAGLPPDASPFDAIVLRVCFSLLDERSASLLPPS